MYIIKLVRESLATTHAKSERGKQVHARKSFHQEITIYLLGLGFGYVSTSYVKWTTNKKLSGHSLCLLIRHISNSYVI